MTVHELFRVCELAIQDGHGDAVVMFDTEARTFDYVMAKIDRAYLEDGYDPPFLGLYEMAGGK